MEIPKISLGEIENNSMCFGCGKSNQYGFKLQFKQDGDGVKSDFTPTEYHQGWPGFTHGGAMMTVLDEAIGWAAHIKSIPAVTAKIEIRLKSMARIGEPLIVSGRIVRQTRRTLDVEADIKRPDGSIVAEASSVQFIMDVQGG